MSKIRIIDLLNKIANGEEVPERIKHYQTYYTWYDNGYSKGYCKEPVMTDGNRFLEINTNYDINKEVEIIEEEPEIDIQKIEVLPEFDTNEMYNNNSVGANREMINELIKVVKQLDKKIKEK